MRRYYILEGYVHMRRYYILEGYVHMRRYYMLAYVNRNGRNGICCNYIAVVCLKQQRR